MDPDDPLDGFRAVTGTKDVPIVDEASVMSAMSSGLDANGCDAGCASGEGFILIANSPSKGYFCDPTGQHGTVCPNKSVWPLLDALNACTIESCWWGPSYSADTTPNLFAHELYHALTGGGDSYAPHLADTVAVASDVADGGLFRRGYKADDPPGWCAAAINGEGTKDYTQ